MYGSYLSLSLMADIMYIRNRLVYNQLNLSLSFTKDTISIEPRLLI